MSLHPHGIGHVATHVERVLGGDELKQYMQCEGEQRLSCAAAGLVVSERVQRERKGRLLHNTSFSQQLLVVYDVL